MFYEWINEFFYGFDQSIFRFLFEIMKDIPWLYILARIISFFGDHGYFFIFSALVFLVFRKTRKLGILVGIGLIVGSLLNNTLIKNIVARPRPYDEIEEYFYMWKYFSESGVKMHSYSFPSGHTCMATVFGIGLFIGLNKKYSWIFILIPLLMGWSRIALFVHYPSDVLFGMVFGTISIICAYFLSKLLLKWKFLNNLTIGDKLF